MRVYWAPVEDTKAFVRSRYPALEATCSLFGLDDGDVLLGDHELLARQTIAYWVDDAYFSVAGGEVDLSIPYNVSDLYVHDGEMMGIAKRYAVNPEHPPSAFDAELACVKISLTLQAALWNAAVAFVPVKAQAVKEDVRVGRFLLLTTDANSVKALRMLVESGRMDLVKTLAAGSRAHEEKYVIGTAHGSSSDHVAVDSLLVSDKKTLEELTDNGKKPLQVFFQAEGAGDGKLVGFPLNVKI